jgi:hypothetical protein
VGKEEMIRELATQLTHRNWYRRKCGTRVNARLVAIGHAEFVRVDELHPKTHAEMGNSRLVDVKSFFSLYVPHRDLA